MTQNIKVYLESCQNKSIETNNDILASVHVVCLRANKPVNNVFVCVDLVRKRAGQVWIYLQTVQ